jgi:hypothetical protein
MDEIRRARPVLMRAVIAALRHHYRLHRKLRTGPLTVLAGRPACADIVMWGEIEHRLRIARLATSFSRAAGFIEGRWRQQ